jgi:hypothetical protein
MSIVFSVLANVNLLFQIKLLVIPIKYPIGDAIQYSRVKYSVKKYRIDNDNIVPVAPMKQNFRNCVVV